MRNHVLYSNRILSQKQKHEKNGRKKREWKRRRKQNNKMISIWTFVRYFRNGDYFLFDWAFCAFLWWNDVYECMSNGYDLSMSITILHGHRTIMLIFSSLLWYWNTYSTNTNRYFLELCKWICLGFQCPRNSLEFVALSSISIISFFSLCFCIFWTIWCYFYD